MNKIEYSRFRFKRSTVSGVIPTTNTATTIDNTWASTDLLIGEGFVNVEDDKMWFRTNNGIVEVAMSGVSSNNYYTNYAYLSGNTIVYDRNDTAAAYTVDLSSILGSGSTLFVSGTSGNYSIEANNPSVSATDDYAFAGGYLTDNAGAYSLAYGYNCDVTSSGSYSITAGRDNETRAQFCATFGFNNINYGSASLVAGQDNTISSSSNYTHIIGKSNTIGTSANGSMILGSNNEIAASATDSFIISDRGYLNANNSVILGGSFLSGYTDDTVYVPGLNINFIGSGTSIANLGVDANGFVVTGSTGGGGSTFTGGTVTGPTTFQSSVNFEQGINVSGDTVVEDLSASTITILNSGVTQNVYTDLSSNTIQTGVTDSSIVAGSGNTISSGLGNVMISGIDISATTSDTSYFSNVVGAPYDFTFAVSDETTAITTGTDKIALYAPRDFEIQKVKVSLTTTGSTTSTIDVNVGGTSILSSPVSLTSGTFVNSTTSLATSSITEDDRITVDIDAAGTAAAGLKVYLIGKNNS